MREKRLKEGTVAYFWQPPQIYIAQGFTGHAEALGQDYAIAAERSRLLNAHLDAWRTGRKGKGVEEETKTVTGGSADVTVDLKAGKYEFYCPVDGHRQAGMEGTLTVG